MSCKRNLLLQPAELHALRHPDGCPEKSPAESFQSRLYLERRAKERQPFFQSRLAPRNIQAYSRNVCARNHQAVEKGAEGGRGAIDATGSRETKIGGENYERLMWRCIGKVVFPTQILEEAASRRILVERLCGECILLTT